MANLDDDLNRLTYDESVTKAGVIALAGGGTKEVRVVFDIYRADNAPGYGMNVADQTFAARVRTAEVAGVAPKDIVTIEGAAYTIQVMQADAHGETFLRLKRVNQ